MRLERQLWCLVMYDSTSFYNKIHVAPPIIFLFSFLSLPTDPKFLRREPDKQLINLEWPYVNRMYLNNNKV